LVTVPVIWANAGTERRKRTTAPRLGEAGIKEDFAFNAEAQRSQR
jgi:hypothetical protein